MNNNCSIYIAELVAIQARLWTGLNDGNEDIIILTDSKSAIQAITENKFTITTNEYAIETRKYIKKIEEGRGGNRKVILVWIPSHIGVEGNEIADILAKECTEEKEDTEVKVPRIDLKNIAKKKCMKQ